MKPDAGRFRQGEILANVLTLVANGVPFNASSPDAILETLAFAVVLSQDCDLEQDFEQRKLGNDQSDRILPQTLLCSLFSREELPPVGGHNSALWKLIKKNTSPRYHYLREGSPAIEGLVHEFPQLTADFKFYVTVPTDVLYSQATQGQVQRLANLESPYAEHLSTRFAYYLARIALPEDHFISDRSKLNLPSSDL